MRELYTIAALDGSPPAAIVAALIDEYGLAEAHRRIDEALDALSNVELAAHAYDWSTWARDAQLPPEGDWESYGYLAGRGNGKTLSLSNFVNDEVDAGRAPLICLIAQDEDSSVKLHVTGPSGLIATAPPWAKPTWRASDLELVWPNGSRAYVRTPEVPGKIRGLEYNLTWASELQSWPNATLEEAWMNVQLSTRLGYARIVWDATSKRRHALLKRLLREGEENPARNVVRRGSTYENALNLGRGYIEKIERKYGGSQQGEEELFAKFFDDAAGSTAKQVWISDARIAAPARFARTAIGVDPAITTRAGNDSTGIVVAGADDSGGAYILADRTGQHQASAWAAIVLDEYAARKCDCVVLETNKGGDLVTANLRAAAHARDLEIVVLKKEERPRHVPGIVYVREVHARGEKADRAKPLGTAYEQGRVHHVEGVNLAELEDILTTWIPTPGQRSPDRLDAAVHVVSELLDLHTARPDPRKGFIGMPQAAAAVATARAPARSITALLNGRAGGRI